MRDQPVSWEAAIAHEVDHPVVVVARPSVPRAVAVSISADQVDVVIPRRRQVHVDRAEIDADDHDRAARPRPS